MTASGRTLRVFPDADRVEQALVDAAEQGSGFVVATDFITFAQLVERLGPARRLQRRPCSPLASRTLLSAAARRLPSGPFGTYVQEPAFARAAQELFFELKSGLCGPADFESAVSSISGVRQARATFLARLFATYEAQLRTRQLADQEDLLAGAVEVLDQEPSLDLLQGVGRVEIRHLYDFSPLRLTLVIALARRCQGEQISFQLELPGAGAPAIDALVDPLLAEFERRWDELQVEALKEDLASEDRPLAGLAAHLFRGEVSPERAAAGGLEAFTVGSPEDEARELARRIRARVGEGTPPEEIAIAYRGLDDEAERVAEALEDAGLSARLRRGAPITSTAVGRLAFELPLLVDDGFPVEQVSRWLESRYLPSLASHSHETPAAIFRAASIRDNRIGAEGERGAYQVRLEALADRSEERGNPGLARAARQMQGRVELLIDSAQALPEKGPAAEMLSRWWRCLEKLGLPSAVRRGEPRTAEGTAFGHAVIRALARDQAAFSALQELTAELRAGLALAGASREPVDRRVFQRWLLDAALDFNLPSQGNRGAAVRVLDLRELAGRRFTHVYLAGWNEGRFPLRPSSNPLFPDEDRAQVNRHTRRGVFRLSSGEIDGKLPSLLAEDRLLLHLGLSAAVRTVTVSHSRADGSGREVAASPFFTELERAVGLTPTKVPSTCPRPLDEAVTESELRARVALETLAPTRLRSTELDLGAAALSARFRQERWLQEAAALAEIEAERLAYFSDPQAPPRPFSGDASGPGANELLAAAFRFGPDRPVSASQLGKFGNCAFQGFLAYGLGLEEPSFPGEELDGRGRGSFWHKVLELLVPRLQREELLGKSADALPDSLLDEVLEEAAADISSRDHVGHPALWELGKDRARAMARRVLGGKAHLLPFDGHAPLETELGFGKEGAADNWKEVRLDPAFPGEAPIHLAGTIDRLDSGPGSLGVIDYKSARGKSPREQLGALLTTEFQLPLYLHAAKLSGHSGALQAAWLSLKDGNALTLEAVLEKGGQGLEELLATQADERSRIAAEGGKNFANAVHGLVGKLRQGQFAARPEDCGFCAFKAVCRISERRTVDETNG